MSAPADQAIAGAVAEILARGYLRFLGSRTDSLDLTAPPEAPCDAAVERDEEDAA